MRRNFFTGRRSNVVHLLDNKGFELLRHDITFPLYVEVDEIYNLACPASPVHYQFDPVQTTKTSVRRDQHAWARQATQDCRAAGIDLLKFTATRWSTRRPKDYWGNVNPIGPRSCYDEGKRCAETLFFDYYRQHNLDIKVIRIFNTYGPRMHPNDGRVVSNFVVQALQGQDITSTAPASRRAPSATSTIWSRNDQDDGDPGGVTGPINLGNPVEQTVSDLAGMIIRLVGSGLQDRLSRAARG